jgi:tripartite-type tricarboxylate transporter receptor subunit TctC
MAGVNLIHVPYRSNGPALVALLGGQAEVLFPTLSSSIEYIKTGKLRGLAVTTAMRSEAMPELRTVGEYVPGYEISAWYGMGAPKGTPTEAIDKLNRDREIKRYSPTPRRKRGLPTWAARCLRARPPILASSLPRKLTSGPR